MYPLISPDIAVDIIRNEMDERVRAVAERRVAREVRRRAREARAAARIAETAAVGGSRGDVRRRRRFRITRKAAA